MTEKTKFTTHNIIIWLTITSMLAVFIGYAIRFGEDKANIKSAIQLLSQRTDSDIHNLVVQRVEDRTAFDDHCALKRVSDEKLQSKVDDIALRQVKVMTNQTTIQQTLEKIDNKLHD